MPQHQKQLRLKQHQMNHHHELGLQKSLHLKMYYNLNHQQQIANVIRGAHDALQRHAHEARVLLQTQAQSYASDTQRIQQEAVTTVRNCKRHPTF